MSGASHSHHLTYGHYLFLPDMMFESIHQPLNYVISKNISGQRHTSAVYDILRIKWLQGLHEMIACHLHPTRGWVGVQDKIGEIYCLDAHGKSGLKARLVKAKISVPRRLCAKKIFFWQLHRMKYTWHGHHVSCLVLPNFWYRTCSKNICTTEYHNLISFGVRLSEKSFGSSFSFSVPIMPFKRWPLIIHVSSGYKQNIPKALSRIVTFFERAISFSYNIGPMLDPTKTN